MKASDEIKMCLSCGRLPAALCNEDGAYCVDCMKYHLLEKMFVQLNNLAAHREGGAARFPSRAMTAGKDRQPIP